MRLTPEQKVQALQSAQGVSTLIASSALGIPSIVPALVFAPIALGLIAQATRVRFPQIQPEQIGRQLTEAEAIRRAGRLPFLFNDPFSGSLTLAAADQAELLPEILADRFVRRLLRTSSEALESRFDARQREIALRSSLPPRFESVAEPRTRQCGFFRETATSDPEFRCFS